jgi:hypothetical protein
MMHADGEDGSEEEVERRATTTTKRRGLRGTILIY